jgi:hypothetical protein
MLESRRSYEETPPPWVERLEPDKLIAMPLLPAALAIAEDGQALITERARGGGSLVLVQRKDEHHYQPQPLDDQNREKLETAAAGLDGESSLAFWLKPINSQFIVDDENIPPYLKRYVFSNERCTNLDLVRSLQKAALEQAYADKAVQQAHTLLGQYLSEADPQEPTAPIVVLDFHGTHYYSGKFAGKHVMRFSPPGQVTAADIGEMNERSEIVLSAAHELLHQRHAEVLGRDVIHIETSKTQPYNQDVTDDPFLAYKTSRAYRRELIKKHNEQGAPEELQPADEVVSIIAEVAAYAGEEELRYQLGLGSVVNPRTHLTLLPSDVVYREAVEQFLAGSGSEERRNLVNRLMRIDLESISGLSDEELQDIISTPKKILELPLINSTAE